MQVAVHCTYGNVRMHESIISLSQLQQLMLTFASKFLGYCSYTAQLE